MDIIELAREIGRELQKDPNISPCALPAMPAIRIQSCRI